jgi:hypothetical protein
MFIPNAKAKLDLIFHSKLKKLNIKVLSDPNHKPKIIAKRNLQNLKEEKSCKGSKVYKKFQKNLSLSLKSFYLYQTKYCFKLNSH